MYAGLNKIVIGLYVYDDADGKRNISPLLKNTDDEGRFIVANDKGFDVGCHFYLIYSVY